MVDTVRLRVNRSDLAKFIKDQRTLKAFENLFVGVDENKTETDSRIDEVSISADNANVSALTALALIEAIQNLIDLKSTEPVLQQSEIESNPLITKENESTFDYLDFNVNNGNNLSVGRVSYGFDDTLNVAHSGGVIQQVGEEIYIQITNNTGSTLVSGDVIGISGSGIGVAKFNSNGSVPPMYLIGVATQTITNGARGRVTSFGQVRGLNTSAFAVGDIVYSNPAVIGGITKVKPTAPNVVLPLGVISVSDATNGQLFVRPILEQQRYYGSFAKLSNATLSSVNTATAITLDTTTVSNGVSIGTPTSRIICTKSGLYSFIVSFQLTATSSSIKDVYLWFRKNGTDIANSTIIHSLESGTAKTVQSRNYTISMNANDYIELFWASPDTGVQLSNVASTSFSPAAPAVILNVNQIQQ